MEQEQREFLCEQLGVVDKSLDMLVLVVMSTFLSWRGTALQRAQLCRLIQGDTEGIWDLSWLWKAAALLVIGPLAWFFLLSERNYRAAVEQGLDSCRSTQLNLWASGLVLAAGLVRLYDIAFVRQPLAALDSEGL